LFKAFQNVALAKVSESAKHAKEMGFLTESDRIVMNDDHLLSQAKRAVIEMHEAGYVPLPPTKSVYALGQRGMAYLIMHGAQNRLWGHYITEHEDHVARKLAYVMAGGHLSGPQWVSEQYFLDLELEVFLSLCGESKTLDRMKQMLVTGKPSQK
jgi:3-hydroxyacyl-CoA dehydrogenase